MSINICIDCGSSKMSGVCMRCIARTRKVDQMFKSLKLMGSLKPRTTEQVGISSSDVRSPSSKYNSTSIWTNCSQCNGPLLKGGGDVCNVCLVNRSIPIESLWTTCDHCGSPIVKNNGYRCSHCFQMKIISSVICNFCPDEFIWANLRTIFLSPSSSSLMCGKTGVLLRSLKVLRNSGVLGTGCFPSKNQLRKSLALPSTDSAKF